jgi:hypothetical protein
VLAVALLGGPLMLGPAHPILAQDVVSAAAIADSDAGGAPQVVVPAALVRPPAILQREGNVLTVLVLPAAEAPPVSDSGQRTPALAGPRPPAGTHHGGYGSGYQGLYSSGYGEGDGYCADHYAANGGGWCPTVQVTGIPVAAP